MSDIYFIGCDMGGWHTKKTDAIATLKWNGSELESIRVKSGRLFYPFNELQEILPNNTNSVFIIAIDGALSWPAKFKALVKESSEANHCPSFELESSINNPYLYRETERFIKDKIFIDNNKRPLSAPGDKFGNNSSKAQALVAWFKKEYDDLYRPPFDEYKKSEAVNKKHTLIEVYPAASMINNEFKKLTWPSLAQTMSHAGNTDIADAKRCAMTAVCYAKTIGLIDDTKYPDVYTPDDAVELGYDKNKIRKEGWIFAPKP